jgi:putative transposase
MFSHNWNLLNSNELWQCDFIRLNILLINDRDGRLERPWLTAIIDNYSECIMGIHLGFNRPSSKTLALALRHAILPKHYRTEYCEWETTYCIPKNVVTDNAHLFDAKDLQQISLQLNLKFSVCDFYRGYGIVERTFHTINTEFLSTLTGYLDTKISHIPSSLEASEKDYLLTLGILDRLLVRYIFGIYNHRLDARKQNQTRFQKWQARLSTQPNVINERDFSTLFSLSEDT